VLAHENQLDRAETIITVKEPPTASNIKITDNLIESHPCGPTITPGLPSFLQRTPLVDYSVDFTISDPSVIESVALNIDGKLTEPQLLSDIGTGTPNEYSYRLYKIMGRDESDFSFKQFLVGICSDIAGLGIGTGSAFCPFEMFVDAPEPKKDYGELWELKLIRNDGYKYPVTVTGKPKLRTIHDRAPRDSLSRCDVAVFSSYSPVDLLVTDDLGRQIGNTESGEVIEIPNSYYTGPDKGNEFIVVFSPETGKELSLEVKGTGIGEYGLLYGYYKHDEKKVGGYIKQNVPISEGTLHDYSIVPGVNNPPSCSDAIPSIDNLWSPNHKFVSVDVLGVTDPEGDAISITVDSIFQDEPVDGYGDGSFTPDGRGVGTSTAGLRGVPKSSSPYKAPVDEGPLYDSTKVGQ
jgi:hypothetical protein